MLYEVITEGTRKPVAHWKTGCWRIASAAGMPLLPVAIDYRLREIVIYAPFQTGGEVDTLDAGGEQQNRVTIFVGGIRNNFV